MLLSRVRHRYIALVAIALCICWSALYWHLLPAASGKWYSQLKAFGRNNSWLPSSQRSWIFKGPDAEDKAVILAKIHDEDVSWVMNELQE